MVKITEYRRQLLEWHEKFASSRFNNEITVNWNRT